MCRVKKFAKKKIILSVKNKSNFSIQLGNHKNLFPFFEKSLLVISSAGVTMYEHLYTGSKSLIIPQSRLQRNICKNYESTKTVNYIKSINQLNSNLLIRYLKKKISKKIILKRKKLFDGNGTKRLTRHLTKEKL